MAFGYDPRLHPSKFKNPIILAGSRHHKSLLPILVDVHVPIFSIQFIFSIFWTSWAVFPFFSPKKNSLSRLGSEGVCYDTLCFNQAMSGGISWRGTLQLLRSMKLWLSWDVVG